MWRVLGLPRHCNCTNASRDLSVIAEFIVFSGVVFVIKNVLRGRRKHALHLLVTPATVDSMADAERIRRADEIPTPKKKRNLTTTNGPSHVWSDTTTTRIATLKEIIHIEAFHVTSDSDEGSDVSSQVPVIDFISR